MFYSVRCQCKAAKWNSERQHQSIWWFRSVSRCAVEKWKISGETLLSHRPIDFVKQRRTVQWVKETFFVDRALLKRFRRCKLTGVLLLFLDNPLLKIDSRLRLVKLANLYNIQMNKKLIYYPGNEFYSEVFGKLLGTVRSIKLFKRRCFSGTSRTIGWNNENSRSELADCGQKGNVPGQRWQLDR